MLLSKIIDKLNGIANLNEESLELKAEKIYTQQNLRIYHSNSII